MFYLLLIIPHLLAVGGLLFFAYRTDAGQLGGGAHGGSYGDGSEPTPGGPRPGPSVLGPPLPEATQPRRLRVGERLSAPARRRRREHRPLPRRAPRETESGDRQLPDQR